MTLLDPTVCPSAVTAREQADSAPTCCLSWGQTTNESAAGPQGALICSEGELGREGVEREEKGGGERGGRREERGRRGEKRGRGGRRRERESGERKERKGREERRRRGKNNGD